MMSYIYHIFAGARETTTKPRFGLAERKFETLWDSVRKKSPIEDTFRVRVNLEAEVEQGRLALQRNLELAVMEQCNQDWATRLKEIGFQVDFENIRKYHRGGQELFTALTALTRQKSQTESGWAFDEQVVKNLLKLGQEIGEKAKKREKEYVSVLKEVDWPLHDKLENQWKSLWEENVEILRQCLEGISCGLIANGSPQRVQIFTDDLIREPKIQVSNRVMRRLISRAMSDRSISELGYYIEKFKQANEQELASLLQDEAAGRVG